MSCSEARAVATTRCPALRALSIIVLFAPAAMGHSMPEIQKRDEIEDQDHEGGHKERDGGKPRGHELAVAGARRRHGNTDNVVESSEKLCEQFDHSCLRVAWAYLLKVIFCVATHRT